MNDSENPALVDPSAWVADTARLAVPSRPLLRGEPKRPATETVVGASCWIGQHCVLGAGSRLGEGSVLDHGVQVDSGVRIGSGVLATHRAQVGMEAVVGDGCVIAGFVCDGARVGRGCRVFGALVHRQLDPGLPWDEPTSQEPSPVLEDFAFVGWGATVIGGVVLGRRSYVCAGATVTSSVPDGCVAFGVNRVVPAEEWSGQLGRSPFFGAEEPAKGR